MTSEIRLLSGRAALSAFALNKTLERLQRLDPGITGCFAQYVHLLNCTGPLDDEELDRATSLLDYGPTQNLPSQVGELVGTVLPRAGTISPWSSKASDIFFDLRHEQSCTGRAGSALVYWVSARRCGRRGTRARGRTGAV